MKKTITRARPSVGTYAKRHCSDALELYIRDVRGGIPYEDVDRSFDSLENALHTAGYSADAIGQFIEEFTLRVQDARIPPDKIISDMITIDISEPAPQAGIGALRTSARLVGEVGGKGDVAIPAGSWTEGKKSPVLSYTGRLAKSNGRDSDDSERTNGGWYTP